MCEIYYFKVFTLYKILWHGVVVIYQLFYDVQLIIGG
jgi:hypothetical protein